MRLANSLSDFKHIYQGKVRDVYEVDANTLLLVTSSRVSAYDRVFPTEIPMKAEVLNMLASYWFGRTEHIVDNHLITTQVGQIFIPGSAAKNAYRGCCALVRKTEPVRFECVVRGHLDGSAWREYEETGQMCGHKLPAGLKRYDKLPEPIFTPATKNDQGHDVNISIDQMKDEAGAELTERLQKLSLELYDYAYKKVLNRQLLLLDTKFEFGFVDDELILIDEIFTPDSSRYRTMNAQGDSEPLALDKQYLRDWLTEIGYKGDADPPELPDNVVNELSRRYRDVFQRITRDTIEYSLENFG